MIIVLFVLIGLFILLLFLFIKHKLFISYVLNNFKTCNCIVSGKKGTGKDLLFQYVINKRKKHYYSNISYGGDNDVINLKQVSCEPNDYMRIVEDNIVKSPHCFYEGSDFYISDIGIFLPSYMDSTLYKRFPSMPIFYALSRHLYNCNIHCNTQNIERGWKALREQADFYVICRATIKLPFLLITKITTYDNYVSAKNNLRPLKARFMNKYSKAQYDLYKSQNGNIREGLIINFKHKIKYDTRAFEKILLDGERLKPQFNTDNTELN